ncbi:hypothetical protein, partial [Neptuniibacter sp.]|uniref:hypothetical protein n=1 Tax=Neptuniibacter sp. TaxID=1962643 RepID=UPI002613EA51
GTYRCTSGRKAQTITPILTARLVLPSPKSRARSFATFHPVQTPALPVEGVASMGTDVVE